MRGDPPSRLVLALSALGVVLLALATYLNATANGFASDDGYLIEANPRITSLRNVPSFFATDLFDGGYPAAMYYRPLVPTSFAIEYALAGATPFVYHLTNVLLHALVCALTYLLALRLFGSQLLALVAAAVFAVHPVHTEAVAAISGRGDLLGAVFVLAAGKLYADGGRFLGARRIVAILACFSLALLSKESSVAAIALFPLIDLVQHENRAQPFLAARALLCERARVWLGLAAVAAAFLAVREFVTASDVAALGFMGNRYALDASLAVKLATCAKLLGMYLELLVFPLELSADYDYNQIPLSTGWLEAASLVPILVMLALVAAAGWSYRAHAPIFFGCVFLLVGVVPFAFLLPFLTVGLAERYLYLPSLGLCIALGAIVARVPPRGRSAAILALIALVILPAAARTVVRNRDWRDNETLYSVTVETAPNSSKAHAKRAVNLAMRAESEERAGNADRALQLFQQARLHYERALDIDPLVGSVRAEYGLCLAALGSYELAEAELSAAIQLGRGEALAYLYQILIEQSRHYAATSPRRAQNFHGRARDLFRVRIRPVSPPEEAARMAAELDGLGRELRNARSASGASP